jgi:hypothetical protein
VAGNGGAAPTEPEAASGAGAGGGDSGDPLTLRGVLLDYATKRPLVGRRLLVRQKHTTSDAKGRFQLDGVSESYDLVITEANGSVVSIYQGLTRRDPVVLHRPYAFGVEGDRSSWVRGMLSKPGNEPLTETDSASVQFFSPLADARIVLGGQTPPFGPDYELFVQWSGAADLKGTVFARGTFAGAGGDAEPFFAMQQLELESGEAAMLDLELSPIERGKVGGSVSAPADAALTQIEEYFRLPLPNAVLAVNDASTSTSSFEHEVDDLRAAGGTLCVAALGTGNGSLRTERCGIELGTTDVSLELQSPPVLSEPDPREPLDSESQFSWTAFDDGVHRLALETSVPTASSPNLYVYTAATSVTWSSLAELGAPAQPSTHYTCTVSGFGPFSGLDDAAALDGLGSLVPTEQRTSESAPVELTAMP